MSKKTSSNSNITKEILLTVNEFRKKLFSDDTEGYWATICKIDQARVYGMFQQYTNTDNAISLSFGEYVKRYIQADHAEINSRLSLEAKNLGISHFVRRGEDGDVVIQFFENVQAPRHYIAPTEVPNISLTLTPDIVHNGEMKNLVWKVRLYTDHLYKLVHE